MNSKVVKHTIKDNQLRIENKEYFPLNISKIVVGVENSDKTEIVKNPETGLNYAINAVEAQEIFNLKTQSHHPWFILDLETGSRGWFPGCHIHADILDIVDIKKEPSDESETLSTESNIIVRVLEIKDINEEPINKGWYKIKYIEEGYVKKEFLSNIRYEEPF